MRILTTIMFVTILLFTAKADTLTLSFESLYGIIDEEVEVSVTATGFDSLAVWEGSIEWDTLGLDFVEVKDFGINNLNEQNFGRPINSKNKLTFSWTEASSEGESVDDGTVVFTLVFKVIGIADSTAIVRFADEPLDGAVFDKDLNEVALIENSGTVTIVAPLTVSATVENITCFDDADGSISLMTVGGLGNYQYSWNNGSDSSVIVNLEVGTYAFTVTDTETGLQFIDSIPLVSPDQLVLTITDITGEDDTLGSITVDAMGGISPYAFSWNDTTLNNNLTDIANGVYIVTVTDALGCTVEDSITIDIQIPSSLHEIDVTSFVVYPNPTHGWITVRTSTTLDTGEKWTIYNNIGQIVKEGNSSSVSNQIRISIRDYQSGIYLLKIREEVVPIILKH